MSFTVYTRKNYIGLYTGDWTEPHLTTLKVFTDFEEANDFLLWSRAEVIRKRRERLDRIMEVYYTKNRELQAQGKPYLNFEDFVREFQEAE